ncbi:capsid protein [Capybara associated smacovirus 1_cap1_104]|uniref:Capsid protein n=1 Tax=Capybara associated smacovirus 1_cap1_104 TaxID=2585076 RepID=A0A514TS35_9VIRU|nr:capsid protein [Capybara associated smacovirus 1_cap1_104]QDJ95282.1 capsid protein [Capybara associated smacovirus 1_cap1_104]
MVVKCTYEYFFDINTETDRITQIKVTAGGHMVWRRCTPYFGLFRRFKLGSVKVRMVPASTLPVDPTGLSYEAGEATVDPRDQFNPGLFKITNGYNVFDVKDWDEFDSDRIFYSTMLDRSWSKFMLQNGFSAVGHPKYFTVGTTAQTQSFGDLAQLRQNDTDSPSPFFADIQGYTIVHEGITNPSFIAGNLSNTNHYPPSSFNGQVLIQGEHKRLGWLPCQAVNNVYYGQENNNQFPMLPIIPEIELMHIILPRANKTKYYYRVYVEETVYFDVPVPINSAGYTRLGSSVDTWMTFGSPLDVSVLTKGVEARPPGWVPDNIQPNWFGGGLK